MDKTPASVIRPEIRSISAYHVPDSRGLIKLDAMENPYRLPAELRREVESIAADTSLNRYPDASASALKASLRQAMNIPDGMDVLLGNGSDELIQILALAVQRPEAVLMSVEPSFVMFRMVATFAGLRYTGIPLGPQFELDAERMCSEIARWQPALTFIAYPNNPTGNLFDEAALHRVIQASPGLVVVDEAYHVFARKSFLPALEHYPNLLVMRTVSKLGLAGLRLGLLVGRPEWVAELDKLRLPYNVNALTQAIAARVLAEDATLESQAAAIRAEREKMHSALVTVADVNAFPSSANFILFRVRQADAVHAGLKARGVLIKNLNGSHPSLEGCLRVTVGTPEENLQFLHALRETLRQTA